MTDNAAPAYRVMNAITESKGSGLMFDELVWKTGLHRDQLEAILSNLRRDNKIKTLYSRWYLMKTMPSHRYNEKDQAILRQRKKVLHENTQTIGRAMSHHKAALAMYKQLMEEQLDMVRIERVEVPKRIRTHEVYSGPRQVIWSEEQRQAYRTSLKREAG